MGDVGNDAAQWTVIVTQFVVLVGAFLAWLRSRGEQSLKKSALDRSSEDKDKEHRIALLDRMEAQLEGLMRAQDEWLQSKTEMHAELLQLREKNQHQEIELVSLRKDLERLRDEMTRRERDSGHRWSEQFEHAPVAVLRVLADGTIDRCNRAAEEVFQYTQSELRSLTWQQLTHEDDVAADEQMVAECLDGERTTYEMLKRYLRKDGSEMQMRLFVVTVRPSGMFSHFNSFILLPREH